LADERLIGEENSSCKLQYAPRAGLHDYSRIFFGGRKSLERVSAEARSDAAVADGLPQAFRGLAAMLLGL
jgi:hypothetical protein